MDTIWALVKRMRPLGLPWLYRLGSTELGLDLAVINIDLVKAYNKTKRATVCKPLRKCCPTLLRHYFALAYDPTAEVQYEGMEGLHVAEGLITGGLITGDPLAPIYANLKMCFRLILQKYLYSRNWDRGHRTGS